MRYVDVDSLLIYKRTNVFTKRNAHFEDGEDCRMLVTEDLISGGRCTSYRYFTIRAKRNYYGHWQYQLNDKFTGAEYMDNTWFSESAIKDAA